MPLPGFDELMADADRARDEVPVVAAGGEDETVLLALDEARRRRWVRPVIVGDTAGMLALASGLGIDLSGFSLVESPAETIAATAVERVRRDPRAFLMKGRIATPDLMAAVLDPGLGLRSGRTIAQVVLMEIPRDGRRFLLADTGIMISPSARHREQLVEHVRRIASALGSECPRVAMMAASEKVTVAMPETVVASEFERRNREGQFPGCVVEGPLSFDLAYASEAADKKRVGGVVAGAADAMVFPGLASANLTVKAIMYTADCRFGGMLAGTTHPVVFMSRADRPETRVRSLAYALAVARGCGPGGSGPPGPLRRV